MKVPSFLKNTTIKTKRLLMFYLGAMNFMYVYTIMAYSISIFIIERFPDQPNAIFLVGIILAIANLLGMFINGVWSYLQKILTPRSLMLTAVGGIFISVLIFFGGHFLSSVFAIPAFTIAAVFAYSWSYDLYEITMTNVLLERKDMGTQGQDFSQKKVAEGIGMLMGVIVGGLIISLGTVYAQFFLLIFLSLVFLFFRAHFDKEEDKVALVFSQKSKTEWKEVLKVISNPSKVETYTKNTEIKLRKQVMKVSKALSAELEKNIDSIKEIDTDDLKDLSKNATETISQAGKRGKDILNEARIFLIDILAKENEIQRKEIPKRNFHIKDVFSEFGNSFSLMTSAFSLSTRFAFFWVTLMVMFFSFWDTMAITYQPLFLQRFAEDLGFFVVFIMPIFIIPVFLLQLPFGKMADKHGLHIMIFGGMFVSGVSLLLLGTLDILWGGSVIILIVAGIGNSIGYAAAFSPAQAKFLKEAEYEIQQKIEETGENTGNVSSALRLALNIGNIFGQLFGGIIFSLIGFLNGFLLFGVFLLAISFVTLPFFGRLKLGD